MRPVQYEELISYEQYEQQRESIRPGMIACRARRRLHVGENMTLHFENRDTVYYQIQEMIRAEHIEDPQAVRHELETYNELIPGDGELCATLMIEYPTADQRDRELRRLLGLELHVWLVVGDLNPTPARFDQRQYSNERISSVQFARFALRPDQLEALRQDEPPQVLVRVDHPAYQAEAFVTGELLDELRADLGA